MLKPAIEHNQFKGQPDFLLNKYRAFSPFRTAFSPFRTTFSLFRTTFSPFRTTFRFNI